MIPKINYPMSSKYQIISLIISLKLLFSFSLSQAQNKEFPNIISIGNRGYALNSYKLSQELKGDRSNQYTDQLNRLIKELEKHPSVDPSDTTKKKILIFIHGGLNTLKKSRKYAEHNSDLIKKDGYYPIFINWNAGLWSSYFQHLFKIRKGEEWKWIGYPSSPFYLSADLAKGIVYYPVNLVNRVLFFGKELFPRWNMNRKNADKFFNYEKNTIDAFPKLKIQGNITDNRSRFRKFAWDLPIEVGGKAISLALSPLTYPFVDGAGTEAWINLSRRTKTMFRTADQFDIRHISDTNIGAIGNAANSDHNGAAALLFEKLIQFVHLQKEKGIEYEITLIGHSMGSMVANEALRIYGDSVKIKNIVYMAAACKIQNWEASVLSYLKRNQETNFYNLVLHPRAEVNEITFPGIPPGTLLEWIDNFFSQPETFTDRTLGKYENFLQADPIIPQGLKPRIHLKVFDYFGKSDDAPKHHGDFKDFHFWRESFWQGQDGTESIKMQKLMYY